MRKRPTTNISASVHQRLLNRARETESSFNHLLQHFAMERFLYRLSKSEHRDLFILKGALMLTVWQVPQSRPTLDIDLLGRGSNTIDDLVALTRAVCQQQVEPDGISFDPDTVMGERIVEEAEYEGVRLRFKGSLGKAVVPMQIDVGFGDVVVPAAEIADYPTLLDFPAPRLRGYSKESTIAEKFHAMGSRGLLTSRMKDFFDVWLLSRQFDFDGATLAEAIQVTFARRATPLSQASDILTTAFAQDEVKVAQWRAFRRRVEAPESLTEVVADLAGFLEPIAAALSAGRPFQSTWHAPGPWLAS